MKEIRIGDTVEQCVERSDYPPERIKQILGNEIIAVLGYGVQGKGQSLNMRDNGLNVIIGLREGSKGWQQAQEDGMEHVFCIGGSPCSGTSLVIATKEVAW